MTGSGTGTIYALGELLIDLIPAETDMLIRDQGMVIKTVSGSAGIFACAAQLLGGNAGFIGKIGKDSLSALALTTLKAQGVNLDHVTVSEEGQIGLAFLEYTPDGRNYQYYRSRSAGSLLSAGDLKADAFDGAYAVHYPGMLLELTDEMRSACGRLVEIARQKGIRVSFDPNIRGEMIKDSGAAERLRNAVMNADIIAPTLQEGRIITGEESIPDVLRALHEMGPETVALTMDKDGAVISRGGEVAKAEGIRVDAVDPTGAGDTFAAAMCVALREGMPLEKMAAFCNCAGALVASKRGAIGLALPAREETEKLMASGACCVRTMGKSIFFGEG